MAAPEPRTTAQVVNDTRRSLQGLVQAEVDLARAELQDGLRVAVQGVVLLVGALVVGVYLAGFVGVTAAKALEQVFDPWLAWLVVTVVQLLLVAVLGLVGARRLRRADVGVDRTKASIQETLQWAKQLTRP